MTRVPGTAVGPGTAPGAYTCHKQGGSQQWRYDAVTGRLATTTTTGVQLYLGGHPADAGSAPGRAHTTLPTWQFSLVTPSTTAAPTNNLRRPRAKTLRWSWLSSGQLLLVGDDADPHRYFPQPFLTLPAARDSVADAEAHHRLAGALCLAVDDGANVRRVFPATMAKYKAPSFPDKNKRTLALLPCASFRAPTPRGSAFARSTRWVFASSATQKADSSKYDFNEIVSDAVGPRREVPDIRYSKCPAVVKDIHAKYNVDHTKMGLHSGGRGGLLADAGSRLIGALFSSMSSSPPPPSQFPPTNGHAAAAALPATAALLPTSIIICFVDEQWSTLVRTVWSVIDRSPADLIKEIILLDDGSTAPHLGPQLERYVGSLPRNAPLVRILRTGRRSGLIQARLLGARHATAPVLTFLDSHIEVETGWLEPLLARVTEAPRAVVSPQIVITSQQGMQFQRHVASRNLPYGELDYTLTFHWSYTGKEPPPNHAERHSPTDPVAQPAMAGGIYAIRRDYFYAVGAYDEQMKGWGAENVEQFSEACFTNRSSI